MRELLQLRNVRFGSKTDIQASPRYFRFTAESGHRFLRRTPVRNPPGTPKRCGAPLTAIKRRKVSKRLEAREEKIGAALQGDEGRQTGDSPDTIALDLSQCANPESRLRFWHLPDITLVARNVCFRGGGHQDFKSSGVRYGG